MNFECASRTHVGLKRKINEDSILADPDRGFWAVADGMGGHEAGEVASAMVVEALRQLPDSDDLDQLVSTAVDTLRHVNAKLIELAGQHGEKKTIGTTIVGLAIANGSYRCFWLGDSRAYLFRNGKISRVSRDHSLVQSLIDAGMLDPKDAESHESANMITRAVGAAEEAEVEVVGGQALPGDQFVLASDGLTRVVPDAELAAELGRGSAEEAADKLLKMVLSRGAPDNVSLIITRLG